MVSLRYLLNQLIDFDQTCIDTLLGGGEELIRFGDLDLFSRSHRQSEMSKIGFPCTIL